MRQKLGADVERNVDDVAALELLEGIQLITIMP